MATSLHLSGPIMRLGRRSFGGLSNEDTGTRIQPPRLRQLFNSCLRRGIFPPVWRRANLVLLRKEGKDAGSPSTYRPIYLLEKMGKLFKRIIANLLVHHLSRVGPNISGTQYGFREGRSMLDAVNHVRALSDEVTRRGGRSLDISNAFNTLP